MNFKVEYVNKLKIAITLLLIILISSFAYFFKDAFDYPENLFVDMRSALCTDSGLFSQRYKIADNNIIILSVNDLTQYEAARSTELNLTRWPWSREIWARVINFLEAQSPRVLVVDLNFSNYEDMSRNYTSPDMVLANTLGYYDNIVLATALRTPYSENANIDQTKIMDNFANPYSPSGESLNMYVDDKNLDRNISFYSHTPIPNIFTNSTTMGVTNLVTTKNKDENIRYSQPVYKLIKGNKSYYLPSLGFATLLKYEKIGRLAEEIPIENGFLKAGKHLIRVNKNGQTLINWHGSDNAYMDIPINSILLSMVRGEKFFEYEKTKYPLSFFKDKIIIIAQTQQNTETHNTPIAKEITDAQIKATIIDNYINDSDITQKNKKPFVKKITPYKGIILTISFCLALLFVVLISTNLILALFNGSLIIFIYIFLSVFLFAHPRFRIILDMAMPLYFIVSTFLIAFVLKVHHEHKKRKKIETIFGNLVSEKVLKQLVNKPHRLNLKSKLQKVTVMSCNIYNNLQLSDEIPPEKYVDLINKAFNTIEKIIFKYNGTINRFVGNSVLVYWGYPIHSRKDSENAIKAALEIQEKIDEFNETHVNGVDWDRIDENDNIIELHQEAKKYFINIKTAINTGTALIGRIGSSAVSDFTVLGETVDIVEKIENICVEFNRNIITTQSTLDELDVQIPTEYIGQVRVKNSDKKIKIYEISSFSGYGEICDDEGFEG